MHLDEQFAGTGHRGIGFYLQDNLSDEQGLYACYGRLVRSQYPVAEDGAELGGHSLCHEVEQGLVPVLQVDIHQAVVGRVVEHLAFGKLPAYHGFVVVGNDLRDDGMVDAFGL